MCSLINNLYWVHLIMCITLHSNKMSAILKIYSNYLCKGYLFCVSFWWHVYMIQVCEDLCSHFSNEKCSGFLFSMDSQSCVLTSFTGEEIQWYTAEEIYTHKLHCKEKNSYFYRRQRCVGLLISFYLTPCHLILKIVHV